MSVEKITKVVYLCRCELEDCPSRDPKTGIAESWETRSDRIPERCPRCGRHTWNGVDRRTWKQVRIAPDGAGNGAQPAKTPTPAKTISVKSAAATHSKRTRRTRDVRIELPKPRKVRATE